MKTKLIFTLFILCTTYLGLCQTTHNISMSGMTFSNTDLQIKVGDKVVWTNNGGSHTVTQGTSCTKSGFDSGALALNATYEQTFTTTGVVNYFCNVHCSMGMTGKITVN